MRKYQREVFAASILITFVVVGFAFLKISSNREKELVLRQVRDAMTSKLEMFVQAAESELESHQGKVARIVSLMEASQKWDAQRGMGGYLGVALIKNSSGEKQGLDFKWRLDAKELEKALIEKKTVDELSQALMQVPKKSDNQGLQFLSYSNSEGEGRSAMILPLRVKDQSLGAEVSYRALVVAKAEFFQKIIDNKRDALENYILVNDAGVTIGHSISEYVGRPIADTYLWQQMVKSNSSQGDIISETSGSPVLASYREFGNGNLRAIVQMKSGLSFATDWLYYGRWILGLSALGTVMSLLAYLMMAKPVVEIREVIIEKPRSTVGFAGDSELPLPRAKESLLGGFVPQTKSIISAPETSAIIAKLVAKLKAPALSILGQVHLAKSGHNIFSSESVEREARELKEYLDAMSYYAGMSSEPQFAVRVADVLDGALKMAEIQIRQNRIQVSKEVAFDLAVTSQPEDLKMAFYEIIKNAIESMDKSTSKHLVIEGKSVGEQVTLRIRDTGCGISSEDQKHLFEPFFTTKTKLDHRGLGLATAKGIIARHIGTMKIESTSGQGTWVYIELPMAKEKPQMLNDLRPKVQNQYIPEQDTEVENDNFDIDSFSVTQIGAAFNFTEIETPKAQEKIILPPKRLKPRGEISGGNT